MVNKKIDYSKSGQNRSSKKYNKHQLLRKLKNISNKDMAQLERSLFDDKAKYDEKMIDKANELIALLNDEAIEYQLSARNDGGGILARTRGLAGNNLVITVAVKDLKQYNKVKKMYQMRSSERLVGNVHANGHSFYIDPRTELQKAVNKYVKEKNIQKGTNEWRNIWSQLYNDDRFIDYNENRMTYLLKGLTGKLPVKSVFNYGDRRSDVKYDHTYTILDEHNRPIVKFYRKKDKNKVQSQMTYLQSYMSLKELDDLYKGKGEEALVEDSPLKQMIKDVNDIIESAQNKDNNLKKEVEQTALNGGYDRIEVKNEKYDGLNLDTLLAFYERHDIAEVVAAEMRQNSNFDLENPEVIGKKGLKDLLMEETAGVYAESVEPEDLGETDYQKKSYHRVKNYIEQLLEKQGISDVEINYDSDHILHWKGKVKEYSKKEDAPVDVERKGQIGQIFLPDENGVVETKFKTLNSSSERNYNMVMGYVGYYKSNLKENVIKPETIQVADNHKNVYEVVAARDNQGNLIPYRTPKGTFIRPDLLPEEKLEEFNKKVDVYNEEHSQQLMHVATKEVPRTLRDRLRFKGFDQSLQQQLESLVSKQVLQNNNNEYNIDNTSLNKIYHGDVYGIRISDQNKEKTNIVRTYQNRVKFDKSVLDLDISELDPSYDEENKDIYEGEDTSHRFNIRQLDGIFDRSLSTDGANLGLVRYFNKNNKVLSTGEVVPSKEGIVNEALIKDDLPFTEGDPGDRSMMAGNQLMKSRHVGLANVAYFTYKGYTFEDGSVVSEKFAKEQGAIVNGLDDKGNPIPLEVGDKISDLHGNKSTISYIASKNDEVFKENPHLDVVMNPHSVPSRLNTGLVLELENSGEEKEINYNGERIASSGALNVVITDITAKDKTQIYDDESDRKGRKFGNQLSWVASGLNLKETMKEIYSRNNEPFEKLRAYMNVTGLDIDEDTAIILSNGYNNGKKQPPEAIKKVELEESIDLPKEGGYMELPIEVELPSGIKTRYLNVLPEKFRKTQELYDGELMLHEYSSNYAKISESALHYIDSEKQFKVKLQDRFEDLSSQDLSQLDLQNQEELNQLRNSLTNKEDLKEFDKYLGKMKEEKEIETERLQSSVESLTSGIIDEKLGGRSNLLERLDEHDNSYLFRSKNSHAIKQSIIKNEIMSKQVPNSVTSVVTAYPDVDINTIKVSSNIYEKLDLQNENDRVLLWRDPVLHDGSLRSFKIQKDDKIVGVGINPLVTESFGMDFDGDTVGVYAPKSKEAQREIYENASIEKNLLDATSKQFSGNIGMDFVATAYKEGYVKDNRNNIMQGPLKGRESELINDDGKLMNPKDQLQFMLTEMAHQQNGAEKINQLWKDLVVSNKNIGSSHIEFTDRDTFKNSIMEMARIGAKGKPNNIVDPDVENNINKFEKKHNRSITYLERMDNPDLYLSKQSTVMDYYDRGKEMCYHKSKFGNDNANVHREAYNKLYNPYRSVKNEDGKEALIRNIGSLGYDQDKTRMAQSGKTDLTGLAGAKSQTLVSLMYDQKDGAMAAMEVTEPLTQATLKLKQDPKKTPEVEKLLNDFDKMLGKGGYTKEEFTNDFKDMYDNIGLNVRDEHLHEVFNTLSEKNHEGIQQTQPVQEVIEHKMSPLMKANLYGYDAIKECATGIQKNTQVGPNQYVDRVLNNDGKWIDKDETKSEQYQFGNMQTLKQIALGRDESDGKNLKTFKNGNKVSLHIPDNLREVTIDSRSKIADKFAKDNGFGSYNTEETKQFKPSEKKQHIKSDNQFKSSKVTNFNINQQNFNNPKEKKAEKSGDFDLEL